jgi:hypothetical protein
MMPTFAQEFRGTIQTSTLTRHSCRYVVVVAVKGVCVVCRSPQTFALPPFACARRVQGRREGSLFGNSNRLRAGGLFLGGWYRRRNVGMHVATNVELFRCLAHSCHPLLLRVSCDTGKSPFALSFEATTSLDRQCKRARILSCGKCS